MEMGRPGGRKGMGAGPRDPEEGGQADRADQRTQRSTCPGLRPNKVPGVSPDVIRSITPVVFLSSNRRQERHLHPLRTAGSSGPSLAPWGSHLPVLGPCSPLHTLKVTSALSPGPWGPIPLAEQKLGRLTGEGAYLGGGAHLGGAHLGGGDGDVVELPLPTLRDRSDEEELPAILGEYRLFILRTEVID